MLGQIAVQLNRAAGANGINPRRAPAVMHAGAMVSDDETATVSAALIETSKSPSWRHLRA